MKVEKIILLKLTGGLGNQMFQYAFGRKAADEYSMPLKLDVSSLVKYRQFELNIFLNLQPVFATDNDLFLFDRREANLIKKLIYKIKTALSKPFFFVENETDALFILPAKPYKNIKVTGYWQNEVYFRNIEAIIRRDFSFPQIKEQKNLDWYRLIEESTAVAIHIRRGDYLLAQNNIVHGVLSLDYYKEAIKYFQQKIVAPVFFVFSDDIAWVKQHLPVKSEVHYINGNENKQAYIDMHLMSVCKHNIIANSSFSWWGAWLNNNKHKIVIAPVKWFADPIKNALHKNIVPAGWIRM